MAVSCTKYNKKHQESLKSKELITNIVPASTFEWLLLNTWTLIAVKMHVLTLFPGVQSTAFPRNFFSHWSWSAEHWEGLQLETVQKQKLCKALRSTHWAASCCRHMPFVHCELLELPRSFHVECKWLVWSYKNLYYYLTSHLFQGPL